MRPSVAFRRLWVDSGGKLKLENQKRDTFDAYDEVSVLVTEKQFPYDRIEHVIGKSFAITESINLQLKHVPASIGYHCVLMLIFKQPKASQEDIHCRKL